MAWLKPPPSRQLIAASSAIQLHRWALDAPERAKHAAVSLFRTQQLAALLALVEIDARVLGHRFLRPAAARGTGDDGARLDHSARFISKSPPCRARVLVRRSVSLRAPSRAGRCDR